MTSVVGGSDASFQTRWIEKTYDGGAIKTTNRLTGIFSIIITPPTTVDLVRKNPLGIYVHAFNWTQDLNSGDSK